MFYRHDFGFVLKHLGTIHLYCFLVNMHSADFKAWVAVNQDCIVSGHKLYETMFENLISSMPNIHKTHTLTKYILML